MSCRCCGDYPPVPPPVPPPVFRSHFGSVGDDISNASGIMVACVTLVIAIVAPRVIVQAAIIGNTVVTPHLLAELRIDGAAVAMGGWNANAIENGGAIQFGGPLAPGVHTFELLYRTTAGGTAYIRPVSLPAYEHASLSVVETD